MAGVPTFPQLLTSAYTAGAVFNTFTTAKSVINPTELVTLSSNYMFLGTRFKIHVTMGLGNTAAAATVAFQVMMGAIVAWSSGNVQMSTTQNNQQLVTLDIDLRLDSIGSGTSAKFFGAGRLAGLNVQLGAGVANPTVTDSELVVPAGAPAIQANGFDSTISNIMDFWVGFSASNAQNVIQIWDYDVVQYRFGS